MHSKTMIYTAVIIASALGAGCTKEVSFSTDVLPILQENCLSCHKSGADGYTASGFSVEDYAGVMKGTKYGPVVMPGYSYSSTLQILVEHKADPSLKMPHGDTKLPREAIETIGQWIDQGAKDN